MATKKVVHGDDLLYRFFQDGITEQPEVFAAMPQLLISTMAIWLPFEVYERWPILLPWVVRDPACRGTKSNGNVDEWSSPDSDGFVRDDNSLVKSIPRSLGVRGPKGSHVNGARMGTEFVAAHVWRKVDDDRLASRIPDLNSFVPNLAWLPKQVSKLTDREGGVVQATYQAMAYSIYRDRPVAPHLTEIVKDAWDLIPEPTRSIDPIDLDQLNWFQPTDAFFKTRTRKLSAVVEGLQTLERGESLASKVMSTRYTDGLPGVDATKRGALLRRLLAFQTTD